MLSWFARNGVCANLLMLLIAVAGVVTLMDVRQEVFPEISTDKILVSVAYPGAAPAEVEKDVCMRIEEAVDGIAGYPGQGELRRVRFPQQDGACCAQAHYYRRVLLGNKSSATLGAPGTDHASRV